MQHDMTIENASGASVRSDLNNALQALASTNSGASAPSTTFGYQLWADDTNGVIMRRDSANSDWIPALPGSATMVQGKTANYTVDAGDFGTLIDCTSGSFTLSLTAAATLGDGFWFEVKNSGSGIVTIDPNSTELIDGGSTLDIPPGGSCKVWCNGSAFKTVGLVAAEGSWTPVIAGATTPGTQTYSTQVGRYIRQGNLVTVWFSLAMTAKDAATAGGLQISGLPFTSSNISGLICPAALHRVSNFDLTTGYTWMTAGVLPNASAMELIQNGDGGASAALTPSALAANSTIYGTATYRIN